MSMPARLAACRRLGGSCSMTTRYALVAVIALSLLGALVWQWQREFARPPAATAATALSPAAVLPVAPASLAPAVNPPARILAEATPSTEPFDLDTALAELFGPITVLSMFQLQDFPRRIVATVDNLGRSHAPTGLWPVVPVGERFIVEQHDGADLIGADNSSRYTPYLMLIETVDMRRIVALYHRLYPLLQRAYEELGYPNRHFNDRLVEVIDQLLTTPQLHGPLKVHLPAINGPLQPERPWLLYEFDDAALQSLSAGQKILLRMGPLNGQRLRANLAEARQMMMGQDVPRPP